MRLVPWIGCAAAMLLSLPAQALTIDSFNSGPDGYLGRSIPCWAEQHGIG